MNDNVKIFTDMIEAVAMAQIDRIASMEAFRDARIRIMPDVHAGKGCVCGFTANLGDKVVPSLIGVDIGCGMLTVELGAIDADCAKLDDVIHERIPAGMSVNAVSVEGLATRYVERSCDPRQAFATDQIRNKMPYLDQSVGTLGGGNHFCELDVDDSGRVYLVIHTGSRNFGKIVCDHWQKVAFGDLQVSDEVRRSKASELVERLKNEGREADIPQALAELRCKLDAQCLTRNDADLAWLEGQHRDGYLHDMQIAQRWASLNRQTIANRIVTAMGWRPMGMFETIHNYLGDDNIIRKSSISAKRGERVLIPLNMADGSLVCIGKGNADWNNSAPHGAGRLMSRSQARKTLTMEAYRESMAGIFTTSVNESTIDEAKFAYKPSEKIIEQIEPTVDVVHQIKPIYNFKAAETKN